MRSSDTPEAITANHSERRGQPSYHNRDRIYTEEQPWKDIGLCLRPSYPEYTPLNVNKVHQKSAFETLPPYMPAKNETQTIAKTILLTLSQPPETTLQIQSFSPMDPGHYLKMAQKSMQRITPFRGEETVAQRGFFPRVQIQKLINHRRKTTEPNSNEKYLPLRQPRRRFSQVAIITPQLKHPQFQEQGRVCGGKEWKKAFCAAKRQQQCIRKSVSVAVCQIAHQQTSSDADTIQMVIKSLQPVGGVRSHSLPMKVEGRVGDYIKGSNKSLHISDKKGLHQRQRIQTRRVEPISKVRMTQQDRIQFQLKKLQKLDGSNLFRKLNAFRRKNIRFRRQQREEQSDLQQKLLRFQSEQEGERLHGQADKKLTAFMGYGFTNTVYFKNRQSSSNSRRHPPS